MREVIGRYKFRDDQRRELVKHGILPARLAFRYGERLVLQIHRGRIYAYG